MTPSDAAQLLELPAGAAPAQAEARFQELRARLEDKIAKAPTPGLKAKYRESLDEITVAFETLVLAADGSTLPVLKKQEGGGRSEGGGPQDAHAGAGLAGAKRAKSGGKEFAIVAFIAVVVLVAGGWFIMKTRTENAAQARVAAEARLEAERATEQAKAEQAQQSALARKEAEAKAQAEAEEKSRQEALYAQLRAQQAAEKIRWDTLEKELSLAERRLSEYKSDARNTRDLSRAQVAELQAKLAAQSHWVDWLQPWLSRHAMRTELAQFDALLSARAVDEAAKLATEIASGITAAEAELTVQEKALLTLTGLITVTSTPSGLGLTYEDAYGRAGKGITPFNGELPLGAVTLRVSRPGWSDAVFKERIGRDQPLAISATFPGGTLAVQSEPAGAAIDVNGGQWVGRAPVDFSNLPPGSYTIRAQRPGWPAQTTSVFVMAGGKSIATLVFEPGRLELDSIPSGAEVWSEGALLGVTPLVKEDVIPGSRRYEFRAAGHLPSVIQGTVTGGKALTLNPRLQRSLPTEEEIIREFTTKAAGVWKAKMPNSPATSWLKITAGSPMTDGKGKALLVTMRAQGQIQVTDRAKGEMILVSTDPEVRRKTEEMGSVSVIAWENGRISIVNKYVTLLYERVDERAW